MTSVDALTRRFEQVFERRQASVLAQAITEAYSDLVKTNDFNELKAIVKDLADAQKRTEIRMASLETRMEELAIAQKRTKASLSKLALTVSGLAEKLGGLSKSMGYALRGRLSSNRRQKTGDGSRTGLQVPVNVGAIRNRTILFTLFTRERAVTNLQIVNPLPL